MRPIMEPAKPSKQQAFLLNRKEKDGRFAEFVTKMKELSVEFIATPRMVEDAASVIALEMRRQDYHRKQSAPDEEQV